MFHGFLKELITLIAHDQSPELDLHCHERFIRLAHDWLSPPGAFGIFINSYLQSLQSEEHQAGSSLHHENGFTKLSLWKFPNEAQLRLHLYPDNLFVDSTTHSHRWNMSSYVIRGHLKCRNFRFREAPERFMQAQRLYDAKGNQKHAESLGGGVLESFCEYTITAGHGHFLDFRELHRVAKPADTQTITLMLSGPPLSDHSVIAFDNDYRPGPRHFLDPNAIARILKAQPRLLPVA